MRSTGTWRAPYNWCGLRRDNATTSTPAACSKCRKAALPTSPVAPATTTFLPAMHHSRHDRRPSLADDVRRVSLTRRTTLAREMGTPYDFGARRGVNGPLRSCVALRMLLIPGECLAILRAVWNFIAFGFSKAPA